MNGCTAYSALGATERGCCSTRGEHITVTQTWDQCQCDIILVEVQERETSFLRKLHLPHALTIHFPSPGFPLLIVFPMFCFQLSKEKFIAVLLFFMLKWWLQKVHHRLAKGLPCVICLSLVSAGIGMSGIDKLGSKQVGEGMDHLTGCQGCVCSWLRGLINALSFLMHSSSGTKPPGSHWDDEFLLLRNRQLSPLHGKHPRPVHVAGTPSQWLHTQA